MTRLRRTLGIALFIASGTAFAAATPAWVARWLRPLGNGLIQSYALAIVVGVLLLVAAGRIIE